MKKPLALFTTDWHLKENNADQVTLNIKEFCELSKKLNCKNLFVLGDVFHTRKGQSVEVLTAFSNILNMVEDYGLCINFIAGNHDKQRYDEAESYLSPFAFHKAMNLVEDYGIINKGGIDFVMVPFYKEDIWYEIIESYLPDSKGKVLLSHQAMTGSVNNDGSVVKNSLTPKDLIAFEIVLLGHYHDYQQLAPNVFHIPSLAQNNYGENDNKGVTVLYDDFTLDIVPTTFKKFIKLVVDADKVDQNDIDLLVANNRDSKDNIRFEFIGSKEKLKSIDKDTISLCGIDVKTKVKEVEQTIEYYENEIKEFDGSTIIDSFVEYCNEQSIKDTETGIDFINKKLKNEL